MAENKPVIDDAHEKLWYVVNTYAGHENRVKENLEKRVESMGIQDSLFRIVVAEEPEIEIKNGKQIEKMHNMFPGYVFVEMCMTDEAWYVVRNTPGVTGLLDLQVVVQNHSQFHQMKWNQFYVVWDKVIKKYLLNLKLVIL